MSAWFTDNIFDLLPSIYSKGEESADIKTLLRIPALTLDEFKDFCNGYLARYGDTTEADDALVLDLLRPYRWAG